jgi:hypothetical protein
MNAVSVRTRLRGAASRTRAAVVFVALSCAAAAPQSAHAQTQGGASGGQQPEIRMLPGDEDRARLYEHPIRGYTIAVPAGTRLGERGRKKDLFVQSRRGFVVTVQTGDANRSLDLGMMAARLENQYLGTGKPWTRKLGDREITVAGLKAYDGVYEGSNTRTRVVIARGAETDFVFVFRASPNNFIEMESDFNWMLENFRPAAGERIAEPVAPEGALAEADGATAREETEVAALTEAGGGRVFADPDVGYAIRHPSDWVVAQPSEFTTMFSGPQGGPAYYATVSVQNVRPPAAIDPADAVAKVVENLHSQLKRGAQDLQFLEDSAYVHDKGGVALAGRQFVVSYMREGRVYRQWTVVAPRDEGTIAHVWSYAAPNDDFDRFRPLAQAMLESWRIGPQLNGAPLQ